jgi:hypothetical protein
MLPLWWQGCIEVVGNTSKCVAGRTKNRGGVRTGARPSTGTLAIHPKFGDFVLRLWYVSRIEHVIRNYTRFWMTDTTLHSEEEAAQLGTTCALFAEQTVLFDDLYETYVRAMSHVTDSISRHISVRETV